MRAFVTALSIAAIIGLPQPGAAHHSFAEFDMERAVGIIGEITEIRWRNPHVMVRIAVVNNAGQRELWTLEMESVGMLRRMNVARDVMNVGDRITVVGNLSMRGAHALYAQSILLPSGEELVMRGTPHFSDRLVGDLGAWTITHGSTANPELGIFRVWSTTMASQLELLDDPASASTTLTPEAQRAVAAFDPAAASSTIGCAHKGMPRIMQQPDNMAFVQDGDDIRLLIEEYDTVRLIHMNPGEDRTARPPTTLGYSTGVWEGRTLVVTTTDIEAPVMQWALPQSEQVMTVERFTPAEDGSRLDYRLTVTDPAYFTGPLVFGKYWLSIEGAQINPFDCVE